MDWTADSKEMKAQLMRIVVLLLALSALAERACRAPLAVRVSVLAYLRPAEQVAWGFVAGDAAMPEPDGDGDDPASVMLLAARFRALALALAFLTCRLGRWVRDGIAPMAAGAAGNFAGQGGARPQPFDTS